MLGLSENDRFLLNILQSTIRWLLCPEDTAVLEKFLVAVHTHDPETSVLSGHLTRERLKSHHLWVLTRKPSQEPCSPLSISF